MFKKLTARKTVLTLLGALIIMSLVSFADTVTFMEEPKDYDQRYKRDVDGNGFEELTFYMLEDALVLSVWDTDEDGIPDHWFAYGDDDVLTVEALDKDFDGEPDQYFAVDKDGEVVPIEPEKKSPVVVVLIGLTSLIVVVLLVVTLKNKKGKSAMALFLCISLVMGYGNVFAENLFDEECSINEGLFEKEWLKYSHIDSRMDLTTRSPEAQEIQSVTDELKFQYSALVLYERDLGLERLKRKELKNIKSLLVRNIKNNLLKSFIRLTYVTYETIKGAHGNKGSVKAILDKSTAGVKIITSYIKIKKSLSLPSKTETNTKTATGRINGIVNSGILEFLDTGGDFKKIGVNLVNDLQKETFDVVKTNDQWDDANLSDADFKLLKDQYTRNRDFDVLIQESYLLSAQLRDDRDVHLEAIESLESQYIKAMAEEKARVRDFLIMGCKKEKEKEDETDDEITDDEGRDGVTQPGVVAPTLPADGIPTALQLVGDYVVKTTVSATSDGKTQTANTVSNERIDYVSDFELKFSDSTDASDLSMPYNPETGVYEMSSSVEGISYSIRGTAVIKGGRIFITQIVDGGDGDSYFHAEGTGEKQGPSLEAIGIPKKEELLGVYQMNFTTNTTKDGETKTERVSIEVAVKIVNGMIAIEDTSSLYRGMALNYNETTGGLSYNFSDEDMTLTVNGNAVYENGVIMITIASKQVEEDSVFTGDYVIMKLD